MPTSGYVGLPVIILGTNLTGATGVTFNGTPAAFTASSSEITTTVPNGATSGIVQVLTPGGMLSSNVPFQVGLDVMPTSLNFGAQGLNAVNTPQTVTLANTNNQPLNITSIVVTGTNSRDFLDNDNCPRSPNTLAPGDHCNITVVFSPTETGTLTADVTITYNGSDSPQMVALRWHRCVRRQGWR